MSAHDDRLFGLMEEIERSWMEDRDESAVDRLAAEHPEFAEELYLFFATIVDAPDQLELSRPDLAQSAAQTRDWLEREGFARAARSSADERSTETTLTTPRETKEVPTSTFLALLRQTGAPLATLAAKMDVTQDFLVELSRHAALLPLGVKRELVTRAHRALKLDVGRSLASLEAPVELQRAASRKGAFASAQMTFDDLVRQSQLSADQKNHWLQLGQESPTGEEGVSGEMKEDRSG